MRRFRERTVESGVPNRLLEGVRAGALPLRASSHLQPLRERIGFARYVLLGEASHGTLDRLGPDAATAARRAYRCFEPYSQDAQKYARALRFVDESCEDEVISLLATLRGRGPAVPPDEDEASFDAEQNALVVRDAERYYRTMVAGGPESWNLRDRHMTQTLERLMRHHGPQARAIVWEHNTHVGDARYTDMAEAQMVNVGQLVREAHEPDDVVLIGFGTHRGTVIAGGEWEAPMERMHVPPARAGSWEDVIHRAVGGDALLLFEPAHMAPSRLMAEEMLEWRGHRAIGVVYDPDVEAFGNYVPTVLPQRYDAFLFLDKTCALRPLHVPADLEDAEPPQTFPFRE